MFDVHLNELALCYQFFYSSVGYKYDDEDKTTFKGNFSIDNVIYIVHASVFCDSFQRRRNISFYFKNAETLSYALEKEKYFRQKYINFR
jgi:hypothetical protein